MFRGNRVHKNIGVSVFVLTLVAVFSFGVVAGVDGEMISFVLPTFMNVDDTGFSGGDGTVNLGTDHIDITGPTEGDVFGLDSDTLESLDLSHRGTRGLGVATGEPDEIDDVSMHEMIRVEFDEAVRLYSFEVRSLFADEFCEVDGIEESGDSINEIGDVDLFLGVGNVHHEDLEGVESGGDGSLIVDYSGEPKLIDSMELYINSSKYGAECSEFAFAKLNVESIGDDDETPPECSVDYLEHEISHNQYFFADGVYIGENGEFIGFGGSWDDDSTIANVQYNRSSPDTNLALEAGIPSDGLFNEAHEDWQTDDDNPDFVDGWHSICCRAADSAGNVGDFSDSCQEFCIDTQDPSRVDGVSHSNPSECVPEYVSEAPEWEWNEAESNGCSPIEYYEVELYLSNGSFVGDYPVEDTSFEVPEGELENGQDYYIRVRAWDEAGNAGPWSADSEPENHTHIFYDIEDPYVNITGPDPDVWYNVDFDVSEVDSDNLGLYKCEYRVWNDGNFTVDWTEIACNSDVFIDISEVCPVDGLNNCRVWKRVTDNACNEDTTHRQYDLDREAPWTDKLIEGHKYPGEGEFCFELPEEPGQGGGGVAGGFVVGDEVDEIFFPEGASTGVGVDFDGEFLYYTYASSSDLYKIRPDGTGHEVIPTTATTGLGALAYDASREKLWVGATECVDDDEMPIWLIDPVTGDASLEFTIDLPLPGGFTVCFDDGLAYDATDDTLWFSDDVNPVMGHFDVDGTPLGTVDLSAIHPDLGSNSGIAIGGDNFYLGTNGHETTMRVNKDTLDLLDTFVNTDFRIEDMACDPITFGPTEVIWIRDAFGGNAKAYAIEPNTCGLAGEPPEPGDNGGEICMDVDYFVNEDTQFGFECDDHEGSGCDATFYRIYFDGEWGDWQEFEGYFDLGDIDGYYVIEYYSQDNVEVIGPNMEEHHFEVDKLDNVPPVTTKTYGEPSIEGERLLNFGWEVLTPTHYITPWTNITLEAEDSQVGLNMTFFQILIPVEGIQIEESSEYLIEYFGENTKEWYYHDYEGWLECVDENGEGNCTETYWMYDWQFMDDQWPVGVGGQDEVDLCNREHEGHFGEDWTWCKYGEPFYVPIESDHKICFFSQDHVWNMERPHCQVFSVDGIAPSIEYVLNPTEEEAADVAWCEQTVVVYGVEDEKSGVGRVWAELWNSENELVRSENMSMTPYGSWETTMDKELPPGNYTLKIYAEDNLGNADYVEVEEYLSPGVFVKYVTSSSDENPGSCVVDPEEGGECEFTFHSCLRDSDSLSMWLQKIGNEGGGGVTPAMVNATIHKDENSAYVGLWSPEAPEEVELLPGPLEDEDFLLYLGEIINGRLEFDLNLDFGPEDVDQIGPGGYSLDYLIQSFNTEE